MSWAHARTALPPSVFWTTGACALWQNVATHLGAWRPFASPVALFTPVAGDVLVRRAGLRVAPTPVYAVARVSYYGAWWGVVAALTRAATHSADLCAIWYLSACFVLITMSHHYQLNGVVRGGTLRTAIYAHLITEAEGVGVARAAIVASVVLLHANFSEADRINVLALLSSAWDSVCVVASARYVRDAEWWLHTLHGIAATIGEARLLASFGTLDNALDVVFYALFAAMQGVWYVARPASGARVVVEALAGVALGRIAEIRAKPCALAGRRQTHLVEFARDLSARTGLDARAIAARIELPATRAMIARIESETEQAALSRSR